ncbi:MAG: MAPEG family protein [Nevskiales bacterium]
MMVTPLYAGLLALWYLVLSIRVIQYRGSAKIGLGDGGDVSMLRRIRAHANFAEYVPLLLLMIGYLEVSHFSIYVLHALGASLLLARLLHGIAFSFTQKWGPGRTIGAGITFLLLLITGVLCVYQGIQGHLAWYGTHV